MPLIASWRRDFRLWHYSVSYSQLLLRSLNAAAQPRRIDLLFSNVEHMRIDAKYDQLAIEEVSSSDPRLGESGIQPKHGKIFLVNGGPHLVIATHCQWHEDEGGAHSASEFGPLRGTE
jgi:hypothetical protein